MKLTTFFLSTLSLFLLGCSSKESSNTQVVIASHQKKLPPFSKLNGKIIWQQNGRFIKVIKEDKPKTLFVGFKFDNRNQASNAIIRQEYDSILCTGTVSKLGDLDNDETPEFLLNTISTGAHGANGYQYVLSFNESSKIYSLITGRTQLSNIGCDNFSGHAEVFEFDSMLDGGPHLVAIKSYNYFVGQNSECDDLQLVSAKALYTKQQDKNYLYLTTNYECPIEGNEINLAKLYHIQPTKIDKLASTKISISEFMYITSPKLQACGEDEYMGISHLEKLAGIRLKGGNAYKRKDLMPFIEQEFMNVNPSFILWGKEHLIPTPDKKQANGFVYQYLYDAVYENWFRGLALQKMIIESEGVETVLKEYISNTSTIFYREDSSINKVGYNSNTYGYLYKKYKEVNKKLTESGLENNALGYYDYGFWIRRMLDGSEPEIWETLKYVLQLYDGEWYKETGITGLIQIDSVTYSTAKANSIKYNEIVKDQIPNNIVENNDGVIKVNLKNGDIKTYEDNPYEGESEASYHLMGYWAEKGIVIIGYSGYEWGNLILLDLNSGSETYPQNFYPSKGDLIVFEEQDGLEEYQMNIELRQMDGDTFRLIAEYPNRGIKDGFWKNEDFYFEQHYSQDGNPFFKIGKFGFDDILAYAPPVKDIINKSDSIPTDSATVNTN